MKATLRMRMSLGDAHYGGQLVDGARLLALFGDVATELCIRAYGDEGLFRAYQSVEFLEPVRAGDFIEAEGEIIRWGKTSLGMRFSARKVIAAQPSEGASAADVLATVTEVCRAAGTCVVPDNVRRLNRRPPPLIITAALVGAETTREQTPHLPHTPVEIAEEARRCREAGASVIHLHVRTDDGRPTHDRERFRQTIAEIRKRAGDLIIQASTGGAIGMSIEERCQPLTLEGSEGPDMATLNLGTMNFGDEIFVNSFPQSRQIAEQIRKRQISTEIEIYDAGHLDSARTLIDKGVLAPPFHFQFVVGIRGGLAASRRNVEFLLVDLPQPCSWAVAGIGRHQLPMAFLAVELGGHARVGLEDNIYIEKGVLAQGSAPLVERVVAHAKQVGRPVAPPAQAREMLGIRAG